MIYEVNTDGFRESVLERSKSGHVAVLCWATWCGPCKSLKPALERVAVALDLDIAMVDVEQEGELVVRMSVRAVPTLVLFRDGLEVGRLVGGQSEAQLRTFFEKHGMAEGALEFD
ncbi:thioredoxin family protein [Burkholderia gladioli]|uniref:thioredoxin family protein n=1 Tax=Burkholderia gladioli TaxID=28095 RepID=UPI003B50939A